MLYYFIMPLLDLFNCLVVYSLYYCHHKDIRNAELNVIDF